MTSTPSLLFTLPLTSPHLPSLLHTHRPFARPSLLPQPQATKWVQRVNAAIVSRDTAQLAVEEKRAAVGIAAEVIRQDGEGWAVAGWGKGWIGAASGVVHSAQVPLSTLPPYLDLLLRLISASSQYPSFERESIHPIMGKLAIGLTKLLERALGESVRDWVALLAVITSTRTLLIHSPAPFRPLAPSIRSHLLPIITAPNSQHQASGVPVAIRQAALDLFTTLYVTAGKAQASAAWASDVRLVLNGAAGALAGVKRDGWEQSAPNDNDIADPTARLPVALDALQGWVDIIVTYLRKPTTRPVPIPVGPIVSLARRCLDLGIDTPVVEYITPQHHAALIAALPRIWGMGIALVAQLASTCQDHLLPHLAEIVDMTTYLAESVPRSMIQTQIQLLRLHRRLLTLFPPSTLPTDLASRLLKDCISKLTLVLDVQKSDATASHSSDSTKQGQSQEGSKKGKKRARGGEEDGLVGAFEGRAGRRVKDGEVVVEALKLTPLLHHHPLIPPSLLTLSIRTHLSLHLLLPELPRDTFVASSVETGSGAAGAGAGLAIAAAVKEALEMAATQAGERGGWRMGWSNIILGVLSPSPSTSALLHPSLPPLLRPAPPLSALHIWTTESAEEKKVRRELGLKVVSGRQRVEGDGAAAEDGESDVSESDPESEEDEDMEEDMDMKGRGKGEGKVARPRLGGEPAGIKPAQATSANMLPVAVSGPTSIPPAPRSSTTAAEGSASQGAEKTLLVPVAPQDVRSGRPSLDLAAGAAAQPDDVVVLANTATPADTHPTQPDKGEGMDVDEDDSAGGDVPDFIAASAAKGAVEAVETAVEVEGGKGGEVGEEEEDEGIPELDSGMSDFDDDDEEEEEEEE